MWGSPALICQKRRGLAAGVMNLVCQTVSSNGFIAALSVCGERVNEVVHTIRRGRSCKTHAVRKGLMTLYTHREERVNEVVHTIRKL